MKKVWMFIAIFSAMLLMAGCVSIPLTDGGTLEISQDGINVVPAEGSEDVDNEAIEAIVEESSEVEEVDNNELEEVASENTEDQEETNHGEVEGLGGCADEFYLLEHRLPEGFPMTPCAYIRHFELLEDVESDERTIIAYYDSDGTIDEVTEEYINYFSGAGYSFNTTSHTQEKSELEVNGKGFELIVQSSQGKDELIDTVIEYRETPIKQYGHKESIINYTDNGYGKCSDEFYTVLHLLPEGFPMNECAQVTFIQIEVPDMSVNAAAGYEVDAYWTEEFEAYEKFVGDIGADITHIEGLATQGDIVFDFENYSVSISIAKLSMTKSEVHMNVTIKF
ncbi:hypothetical protein ACXYMX_02985 [Sporosarcina sp. CAU 1771]